MSPTQSLTKVGTSNAIRAKAAVKAVVHFSGGNDEGGADRIVLFAEGDVEVGSLPGYAEHIDDDGFKTVYKARTAERVKATDAEIADERLIQALTAPIYQRWGGFAGDFYVSGTCTWDAMTGKVELDYDEEVPQSEHHSEEW